MLPGLAQGNSQGNGKGHNKHADADNDRGKDGGGVRIVFSVHDREVIRDYYYGRNSNLPPGLAKRGGNLPPGLQLKPEDGTLSGTPTLAGVFTFTVIALRQPTSAPTQSLTQGLSLTVR